MASPKRRISDSHLAQLTSYADRGDEFAQAILILLEGLGLTDNDGDLDYDPEKGSLVKGLFGRPISQTPPTAGQVLVYNSILDLWEPSTPSGGGGGGGTPDALVAAPYYCPMVVSTFNVVYLSGADTVDQASALGIAKQPVIGFIISKPTPTTATLQYDGELPGFLGLIPGATYYLSDSVLGGITNVAPSASGSVVQRLGFARNPTTFVIEIDRDFTLL